MVAFEEPHLVLGECERSPPRVKVGDPREQTLVEGDPHPMLGEPGSVVAGYRFERFIGIARIEVEEHAAHSVEQTAAAFQSLDRIGKAWRRLGAGYRGDF